MSGEAVPGDVKDLAALIDEGQLDKIQLDLPQDYEVRVMANQRLLEAKTATLLKLQIAANKVLNPARAEEFERQLKVHLLAIALIDRRYPDARALAREFAHQVAERESQGTER